MRIAVYETLVKKHNGSVMHFDILVPNSLVDLEQIYSYGREYLKSKGQGGRPLSGNECRFCHTMVIQDSALEEIKTKGHHIIEIEGCS